MNKYLKIAICMGIFFVYLEGIVCKIVWEKIYKTHEKILFAAALVSQIKLNGDY